jgi:hypothetical protein
MGSNSGDPMPRLNDLDTVPPPDGGDAYGNATVVRQAPSEILEAVRREVAAEKEAAQSERRPTGALEPKVVVDEPETVVVDLPDERPPAAPAAAARAPTPAAPARAAAPAAPATLDAAALRPARLPQDIEKLVPGASAPKPVEAAPAPDAAADEMPLEVPSSRRKRLIVSIVVAVIVAWLAAMAAVGVSHFAGT